MKSTCETCRFWDGRKWAGGVWQAQACRRHAPIAPSEQKYFTETDGPQDYTHRRFPITNFDDWCGDYEEAP